MTKNFIVGGCSFTYGSELSDDDKGKQPSRKSWAYNLFQELPGWNNNLEFVSTAKPGSGNSGIARRVFNSVANIKEVRGVVVMWSFNSRYDWAMPRHRELEDTRWATISPWDTSMRDDERHNALAGSEIQTDLWNKRNDLMIETGVRPFAEAIYRYAANEYHETYLSWKSIIWLQNILQKKKIPYLFTLADNSLFYRDLDQHKKQDSLMTALHDEIDFGNWFTFGERMMGFNQWATLNDYEYATTHPLDQAHRDAVKLMLPTFKKLIGGS